MHTEPESFAGSDESLPILAEATVSFAVFSLARSHRVVAAELLSPLGLHPSQEILLMRLWQHDGQSQKDLTRCLGIDQSTVARTVQRMESGGLVSRLASVTDGRVSLVYLTDRGRALREGVTEAWKSLEQRTIGALTPAEQEHFIALAHKMQSALDAGADPQC